MNILIKNLLLFFSIFFLNPIWGQNTEFKIATLAPEGSAWMKRFSTAADDVYEQTDGRVSIRYYAGGVMGDENQVLQKMRFGQLNGGMFTASGLIQRYAGLNNYTIPFLFRDSEEVHNVRERYDQILIDKLDDAGLKSFGLITGGYAYVFSKEPIENLQQLSSLRVWSPEGDPISFSALETLDLSPIEMPISDVLLGLQTGLVDIVSATTSAALILQWHTIVRYMIDLPILYTIGTLVIDNRAFNRLSAEDQLIVATHLNNASLDLDALAESDHQQALNVLSQFGLQITSIDQNSLDQWYDRVDEGIDQISLNRNIDKESLESIYSFLNEYRAQ